MHSASPSPSYDEASFKTYRRHMRLAHLLGLNERSRRPGYRAEPELVRLDVAPNVTPSDKPPVRIYVGTEPAQYRAERVFLWSITAVRDPSRVYEIHLMKDLAGFDRRHWKTGFTGYRYAIPALAGGQGRAIYNDVDQIYLADPAELFDLEMEGAGLLSITERETSVMLLDCAKMIGVWDISAAKRMRLHKPFRASVQAVPGLWRRLPGEWNSRDFEYRAGHSKLLHFTILHSQPWQPFPKQLKYEPHPLADLWLDMERAADASGFTIFTKDRPSRDFSRVAAHQSASPDAGSGWRHLPWRHRTAIGNLVRETDAETVALYTLTRTDAVAEGRGQWDGVVTFETLATLPDDDVPWVLDEIFNLARRFVYVAVPCRTILRRHRARAAVERSYDWWHGQLEVAARRHPGIRWVLRRA